MPVTIGALRESAPRETRVSLVPEVTDKLIKEGTRVLMERSAGERAGFPDALYRGVAWADTAGEVLQAADVVLTVQPLTLAQIAQLRTSAVVPIEEITRHTRIPFPLKAGMQRGRLEILRFELSKAGA